MTDTTKLKRDSHSKAVINTDTMSFQRFVSEQKQSRELKKTLSEVHTLRKDVDDIKDKITYSINNWINVSKNARKFVETERTTEKHWEFYENLYKQML